MRQFQTRIYKDIPPFGTCLFHRQIKPREESFLEMIKFTFLPYLQLYSFTFFWQILNTFMFFYSLSYKNVSTHYSSQFLKVSQTALFQLGQNYPYYQISKFHYYRLLTSMILFHNFYHFLICTVGILTLSSYIQKLVGFKRVFVLSILSGAAGQFFGNICHSRATLESCTPICGLIGYLFGVLLSNRQNEWKYYISQKRNMFLLLCFILGIYLYLPFQYPSFSLYSCLFACLFGFMFYFCQPNDKHYCSSIMMTILISVILAIEIFLFFFVVKSIRIDR